MRYSARIRIWCTKRVKSGGTGAPLFFILKYSGAAVIFTGPPVNFTGAPVFVMTLWQYRRTGITLIYHPIRSRLVSHSIQVNLVLCKSTMKSHHFILSIIAVLIAVYFI